MKNVAICSVNYQIQNPQDFEEVWTCNDGYKYAGDITKLFVMHKQVIKHGVPYFDWQEMDEVSQSRKIISDTSYITSKGSLYSGKGFEIITLHDIPELKKTTKYPFEQIIDKFHTNYFSSSFAYMIAYAIYTKYESMTLLGLDHYNGVSDCHDDLNERCGEEFWLGMAMANGIQINIDGHSDLLTTTTGKPYAIDG